MFSESLYAAFSVCVRAFANSRGDDLFVHVPPSLLCLNIWKIFCQERQVSELRINDHCGQDGGRQSLTLPHIPSLLQFLLSLSIASSST